MKGMILAVALSIIPATTYAHSWYDLDCCSSYDCEPVQSGKVTPTANGWKVELFVGDHKFVNGQIYEIVPYDDPRVRVSQDEYFHVCLSRIENRVLCLYVPNTSA